MRTLEQILEGVTDGGKFEAHHLAGIPGPTRMNYALRACNTWPELVRAMQVLHDETADYIRLNNLGDTHHNKSMKNAGAALAEALKD